MTPRPVSYPHSYSRSCRRSVKPNRKPFVPWHTMTGMLSLRTINPAASFAACQYQRTMPTERSLRIAVVEDQRYYRDGLADAINALGGYEVVVRAANGEAYIRACKEAPKVDIAIIDLCMPVMDGWATIAWVRDYQPWTLPAAMTFDPTLEARQRAVQCGARGIVDKCIEEEQLRDLLEDLRTRKFHFNVHMEGAIRPGKAAALPPVPLSDSEKLEKLSKREKEVFQWVLHRPKLTFAQIGIKLNIGECTVESHCKNIYLKLGLKEREDIPLFAARNGMLPDE